MQSDLHKDSSKLNHNDRWYSKRYLKMAIELKEAYELKELYKEWQRNACGFKKDVYFTAKVLLSR